MGGRETPTHLESEVLRCLGTNKIPPSVGPKRVRGVPQTEREGRDTPKEGRGDTSKYWQVLGKYKFESPFQGRPFSAKKSQDKKFPSADENYLIAYYSEW